MSVTYDTAEFTPLILHFMNEFAPPTREKQFLQCAIYEQGVGQRILTYDDKRRNLCTRNPALYEAPLSVPWHSPKGDGTVPLRCTSGA